MVSLSFNTLCGLIDGGGGSIAATPFFFVSFFVVKNDPKSSAPPSSGLRQDLCCCWSLFDLSCHLCLAVDLLNYSGVRQRRQWPVGVKGFKTRTFWKQGTEANLLTTDKIRVRRIDIASLHTVRSEVQWHLSLMRGTHETISDTSFVVGVIAVFKKFTTTELKRSLRAGYRLNACYTWTLTQNHLCKQNILDTPSWWGFGRECESIRRIPIDNIWDLGLLDA